MTTIPSKIRRMSRRRQKIALKRRLRAALAQFEGQPYSEALAEQIADVTVATLPRLYFQPIQPVKHITINTIITAP